MSGMLSAYRPLFAVPGAPRFILGALISRVGGAMFGVAVIVMVSSRRDSYAIAGAISAVGVLVLAIAAPVLGRLIDKHGQRRIALPAILLTSVALFTTTWLSAVGAPLWTLFVAYAVSALLPEVGPMSRARWAHIMRDDPKGMHTAFAFEQVVEEFAFVVGPVLGVLAATTIAPEAGLVLAQILFAGGAILFLAARSTEPPVVPHEDRPPGLAINRPGMVIVPLVLFMVGVLFGANEVVAVAVSDEQGRKAFSSTILAAFALGSAISGIVVGTRDFTTSVIKRFVLLAAAMCVLQAPVLLTDNLWALVGIMCRRRVGHGADAHHLARPRPAPRAACTGHRGHGGRGHRRPHRHLRRHRCRRVARGGARCAPGIRAARGSDRRCGGHRLSGAGSRATGSPGRRQGVTTIASST
jgi:MFS family permease